MQSPIDLNEYWFVLLIAQKHLYFNVLVIIYALMVLITQIIIEIEEN